MSRKMDEKEWARYLELKSRYRDVKKTLDAKSRGLEIFRKYLLGSWVVGLIASWIMFYVYGWTALLETILSWTIGVTIITTFFTTLPIFKKYKRT